MNDKAPPRGIIPVKMIFMLSLCKTLFFQKNFYFCKYLTNEKT